MSPRLSILMPVKNAGKYLEDCLESILDQSYTNWELIAVDDHSSDDSLAILESFDQKDQRIQILNNKGNGIIWALRTAYELSQGELIHRMDADDLMTTHKLENLVDKFDKLGKGHVITAKVKYFAEEGVSDGYLKYEAWLNSLVDKKSHWKDIYRECVIASPLWLVHREDLNTCKAFSEDRYPEDYDLVFRFYKYGLKVYGIDSVLHLWRDHSERSSRNHPHYQSNSFFALKLHYFLELDWDKDRPLLIWGAGPKGKHLAKMLKERKVPFHWISNNPNKHGKEIYGKLMQSYKEVIQMKNPQIIITVAQKGAKKEIRKFLSENKLEEKVDYWFFR